MPLFMFPSGSEWRKWDLHAHTPLDPEWISPPTLRTDADKRGFADQYINRAKEAALSVIAITDHNFCRNFDDLLIPFLKEKGDSAGITILPGFEVSVADCAGTHILALFPEETQLSTINSIVDGLFPAGYPRYENSQVKISSKTLEEMKRILDGSKQPYLLIFAHADREQGVLDSRRPGESRLTLWKNSAVRIAQISKAPTECTGFLAEVINGTHPQYGREMTYINCSDCRGIEPGRLPEGRSILGERFTWIKADPTFEGLRQIIFEPKARVRIQEHRPDEKPRYLTIGKVQFNDPEDRFQPDPIPINPDLTVIIGGKSTGKSILLSSIARAIDSQEVERRLEIARSAVRIIPNMDCEITWKNGDVDRISDGNKIRRITYLPQMHIHALVEGPNRPKLSEIVLGFLKQNPDFARDYAELTMEAEEYIQRLSSELGDLFTTLSAWREEDRKIRELGEKGAINSEMDTLKGKRTALQEISGFTEEETSTFQELSKREKDLTAKIGRLDRLNGGCEEVSNEVESKVDSLKESIPDLLEEIRIREVLEEEDIQELRDSVGNLITGIEENVKPFKAEIPKIKESLSKRKGENEIALIEIQKQLEPLNQQIINQELSNELQEQIQRLEEKLEQIGLLEGEKQTLETRYWNCFKSINEMSQEHLNCKKAFVTMIGRYSEIGDGVSITPSVEFDNEKFRSEFLECFDLRSPLTAQFGDFFDGYNLIWDEETHCSKLEEILKKLITGKDPRLKLGWSVENVASLLFHDFLSLRLSVSQNGEDILSMSPGKQGLILLELLLHLNSADYPILIDQPEDNLDNRSIYTRLVKFLRDKKKDRQIILVTHNPNLVVGADA